MSPIALEIAGRTKPGRREELLSLFRAHLAPRAEVNDAQVLVVWAADDQDEDRDAHYPLRR
jgi:hypothetical protein